MGEGEVCCLLSFLSKAFLLTGNNKIILIPSSQCLAMTC